MTPLGIPFALGLSLVRRCSRRYSRMAIVTLYSIIEAKFNGIGTGTTRYMRITSRHIHV